MVLTADLRKINTLKIIDLISIKGACTKPSLIDDTGLTLVTVNKIINNLAQQGILVENGTVDSPIGKKAASYKINEKKNYIIGIDVNIDDIKFLVCDLSFKNIYSSKVPLTTKINSTEFVSILIDGIKEVIDNLNIEINDILGIGASVPGVVYYESGVIRHLVNFKGLNDLNLKSQIIEKFPVSVFVEKDNYASLLYLKRHFSLGNTSAVLVNIDDGLGCGVMLNGKIYRGFNGLAGELGHIPIVQNGEKCNCGSYGCLEMYLSNKAILKELSSEMTKGKSCVLENLSKERMLTIQDVVAAAKLKDPLCNSIIENTKQYIDIALNIITKSFDPPCIFIDCYWIKELGLLNHYISNSHKNNIEDINRVINSSFQLISDKDIHTKGAVSLVYDHFINNITDNKLLD